MLILGSFLDCNFKVNLKLWGHRETFYIVFFAVAFLGTSYIYRESPIWLGESKTHRDGHNSRQRDQHQSATHFFDFTIFWVMVRFGVEISIWDFCKNYMLNYR